MSTVDNAVRVSEDMSWMPILTRDSLWVIPVMLAFAALLQSKAHLLWSDSRILRKLRTELEYRTTDQLRLQVEQSVGKTCTPNEIFAHLYIRLAKGRHRRLGRLFTHIYIFFTWSLDLLVLSSIVISLLSSDAVSGIRLLIAVGSLTVLGARPLTILETLCILLTLTAYLLTLSLVPNFVTSLVLYWTHMGLRCTAVLVGVVVTSFFVYRDWKCGGTHISNIANAILKKSIDENVHQTARLARMRNILSSRGDLHRSGNAPYWHVGRSWVYIAVTAIMFATNILNVKESLHEQLPSFLVTEAADFISLVLLFFNDTQVEPTLLLELLMVADSGDPEAFLGSTTANYELPPEY